MSDYKYIITYTTTELCEEYTDVVLTEDIQYTIGKIKRGCYGLFPKDIKIFKIGKEITKKFNTKTEFDNERL